MAYLAITNDRLFLSDVEVSHLSSYIYRVVFLRSLNFTDTLLVLYYVDQDDVDILLLYAVHPLDVIWR